MERVWLHVGLPKTGSTSIQASLAQYDDGSCFYAQLGRPNHSQPLYTAFSEQPSTYHLWAQLGTPPEVIEQERRRVLATLSEQLGRQDRHSMIISGEGLSRLRLEEVAKLLDFLQRRGARVDVVAYGRDPLAFAVSACQQLIKQGAIQIPMPLSQQVQHRLEPYRSCLGTEQMIVRAFERDLLFGGCVVQDFCKILSLPSSELEIKQRNEALTAPAIQVLYHLNHTSPLQFGDAILFRTRSRLIRILQQIFPEAAQLDPALLFSRADREDADYLSAVFGVRFAGAPLAVSLQPVDPLQPWLEAIGPDVSEPIRAWLQREVGSTLALSDPSQLIHRLFYACLCRDTLECHADLLHTVACRYEDGSSPRLEEAVQLMDMACQGKPHKRRYQRRLRGWRRLMR